MRSPSVVRQGVEVPSLQTGPMPRRHDSRADDAVWLAERAGLILDPWQEQLVRTGRTTRPDGKWAAFEMAEVVPRQNGKGSTLEALELDRLFLDEDQRG